MSDIVYYFLPRDHMNTPIDELEINADSENWKEMYVLDSKTRYENKKWFERLCMIYFVDKKDELGKLLFELKDDDEEILVKKKLYKFKKEYIIETIKNEEELIIKLKELWEKNPGYAVLYTKQNEIRKIIQITSGETLDLVIKNECADDVEKVIKRWAEPGSFLEYEYGYEGE